MGGYFEHTVALRAYLYAANFFFAREENEQPCFLLEHDGERITRIVVEDGAFDEGVVRDRFLSQRAPTPSPAPAFTEEQIQALAGDPAMIFLHPHVPEIWVWAKQLPLASLLKEHQESRFVRSVENTSQRLFRFFRSLCESKSSALVTVGTGKVAVQQFRGPLPAGVFDKGELRIDMRSYSDLREGTEIRFSFDDLALWHVRFRDYESLYATDTETGELALVLGNNHRTPKDKMMSALKMAFGPD